MTTKNTIKIIVAGSVASGKSTIIDIIEKALKDNGISCIINDDHRDEESTMSRRISSIKDKIDVNIDVAQMNINTLSISI